MSQQSSPKHMHIPTETNGSSSLTVRANETFQIINLVDLVMDIAPLSMIHPPPQKKVMPYVSKNVKTSGKSSKPIIPSEDKTIVEEGSRSKGSEMRNLTMHAGGTENQTEAERSAIDKELRKFVTSILKEVNMDVLPDVQTSLAKETSTDNDSGEKDEESVPKHAALERRSKKKADDCVPEHASYERRSKNKADNVVNVDELSSDEEPLTNIMTPSRAKRLQRQKGKAVVFENSPSKEIKRKTGGLKSTPSRSSIGKSPIGPTRSWSKVVTLTRKRKVVSSSDAEFDVEKDVQDITLVKRYATKKPHVAVLEAPLDNVSLHYMRNAERWKYVIQRRVALDRELGKEALKCKKVVELIKVAGLMKTVRKFGPCYESLVKEFVVTVPDGCDDVKNVDYRKVYVIGNVVTFSPTVIKKFMGRIEVTQAELEVTDDQVCKEIIAKQVRHWPNKGKLYAGKLSVKYDILHRIRIGNWVSTNCNGAFMTIELWINLASVKL
ncbi:uncharacterized protein LOC127136310 [Lathyrus oleraceus]|uniref:uncharacterized protein LOC127136310 n=1 Tax=Pisum sativum TaxID=3888 RepID=UPI0021D31E52|nr:uncharacterized protein LOC127136310 [Pisum sativum]